MRPQPQLRHHAPLPGFPPKPKPESPSRTDTRSPAWAARALYFGSQTLGSNLSAQRPSGSRDREVATNFPGPSPPPLAISKVGLAGKEQGEMGWKRMLSEFQIWSTTFPTPPGTSPPSRHQGSRSGSPFPARPPRASPTRLRPLKRAKPTTWKKVSNRRLPGRCAGEARTPSKSASRPCPSLYQPSPPECLSARARRARKTPAREGRTVAPAGATEKFGSVPHPQKTEATRARDPEREQHWQGAKKRDSLRRGTGAARASGAGRGRVGSPRGRAGRRTSRAAAAAAATSPPPSWRPPRKLMAT